MFDNYKIRAALKGCSRQVCHLLLKESLFRFENVLSWSLKLDSKSTRCDHLNSLTHMEDGCCQIIVTFQAYSTIISKNIGNEILLTYRSLFLVITYYAVYEAISCHSPWLPEITSFLLTDGLK